MKKKFIFFTMLMLFIPLFAENLRESKAFQDAVNFTNEATELQSTGQYDPSINKSKEANTAIDEAFMDALHLLLKKKADISRENAVFQIDTLSKSGALSDSKYQQILKDSQTSLAQGDSFLKEAPSERSSEEKATEIYETAVENFKKAEFAAKSAYDEYIAQKTAAADKAIKEAQSKYSSLTGKGIISKNSADDKKVLGSLQSAQKALANKDFSAVETHVKAALDAMAAAEKSFLAEQAKVKKQIEDAQKKYSSLKGKNIIKANSGEDKSISKLLSDASSALNSADLKKAQSAASNALNQMASLESAYKTASENAKKAVDAAASRYKKLIAENILIQGSDEDKGIADLLKQATSDLSSSNFNEAIEKASKAQSLMDKAEKDYKEAESKIKDIKERLEQAKIRYAELIKTYNVAEDDPDSMMILEDLNNAEDALSARNLAKTEEFINAAIEKMDTFEKMLSDAALNAQTEEIPEPEEPQELLDEDGLPIDSYGRVKILPKYYIVTKREPITDCMWRIAVKDFIYADKYEWKRIYELNKETFVQSENPHLILPGQILEIPSLKGEERKGTYNPKKTYIPITEHQEQN